MTLTCALAIAATLSPYLPDPADKFGWGLRIRPLEFHQPYLARESIEQGRVAVLLRNHAKEERKYLLLDVACKSGSLRASIVRPDGKPLRSHFHATLVVMFENRWTLAAGQLDSSVFSFRDFGYSELPEPGEYELRASLKTAEGLVVAPAVKLRVIEPAADAILASQPVPLEGYQAKWPKGKQEQAEIQQIRIENRTWLVYRKFLCPELGGKVNYTFRLAELPGKVDLRVEGAFGEWGPLAITYKTSPDTKPTKLVINSVDGTPWTEAEERLRQERMRPKDNSPPTGPPPRPIKP